MDQAQVLTVILDHKPGLLKALGHQHAVCSHELAQEEAMCSTMHAGLGPHASEPPNTTFLTNSVFSWEMPVTFASELTYI